MNSSVGNVIGYVLGERCLIPSRDKDCSHHIQTCSGAHAVCRWPFVLKSESCLCAYVPRYEDVWRIGDIAPRILHLGARWT